MTQSFRWWKSRLARAGAAWVVIGATVGCTQSGSNLKNGRGTLTPPPAMGGAQGGAPRPAVSPALNNLQGANTVPGAGSGLAQPGIAPLTGNSLPPTRIGGDSRVGPATTVGNQFQPAGFNNSGNTFNSSGLPATPSNPMSPAGPGAANPAINQVNYQPQSLPHGATLPQAPSLQPLPQTSMALPGQQPPMQTPTQTPMLPGVGPSAQPAGAVLPSPMPVSSGFSTMTPSGGAMNTYTTSQVPQSTVPQPGSMAPMTADFGRRSPTPVGHPNTANPAPAAPMSNDAFVLPPLDPVPPAASPAGTTTPSVPAAAPASTPAASGLREFAYPRRPAPPPMMPSAANDPTVIPPAPTLIPSADSSPVLPPTRGR